MKWTFRSRIASHGAFAAVLLLLAGVGRADPLDLILADFPDILSGFIDVEYDAATQQLIASGFALAIDDDGMGAAENIDGGTFDLTASIDNAGALLGGSLSIGGTVAALGFNSGTLLTGNLTELGSGGSDLLEFVFAVTGGDVAPLYSGAFGGVILTGSGFGGDWAMSFVNAGAGNADVAPVPIPAAAWLLGSGLLGLVALRRRVG